MLKAIQKEVENLRIKVYSGLSTEDTDTALYEIEQMLFKAMDKQLTLTDVSQQRELFDAILDFSEELAMCTEDYHRSELWEKYKALNCG
tara:strand:+ start:1487 stop:1753 length:267 start_codon:yes stop_codon:yes gene_type:complete